MNAILQTQSLTKKFGSVVAVNDLSFSLEEAKVTALLGGNGAGKTTTLSMLLGLLRPTSGKITLFGQDFIRDRFTVLGRMNFSSPYVDLPQRLTVRENLLVYAKLYGVAKPLKRIGEVAELLRIEKLLDQRLRRLSSDKRPGSHWQNP